MRTILEFSRAGKGIPNEDAYGCNAPYAWVIDGATDVFNKNLLQKQSEVSWYVQRLNNEINNQAELHKQSSSLTDFLYTVVFETYRTLNIDNEVDGVPAYYLPTFAISMIREEESVIEYYLLGDCSVAVKHGSEIEVLRDDRVKEFSKTNRKKVKAFNDANPGKSIPLELFQETRKKANTEDGYPIGMVNGAGIKAGIQGRKEIQNGDRVLIFSDGFLDYMANEKNAIERFFSEADAEQEINKMYEYLSNQEKYKENPRPKLIDDCTLLLLEM